MLLKNIFPSFFLHSIHNLVWFIWYILVDSYHTIGRKEMFYLMMHSTHFILWLYVIGHMLNDHSDSERGNPLPPHGQLFLISSNFFFNMHHPTDRIIHTTVF